MRPSEPEKQPNIAEVPAPVTQMGEVLNNWAAEIEAMNSQIQDTIQRLEL